MRQLVAGVYVPGESIVNHNTGIISQYLADRGFGWILPGDQNEPEIFFHADNFWDAPTEEIELGQDVIYMPAVSRTDGKPFAREIRIVSPELIESVGTDIRLYGYVVSHAADKGFGHICPTYSKARLFFHRDLVVNHEDLKAGQLVSFCVREDGKGLVAFDVAPEIETEQESEGSKEVSASV